VGLPIRLRTASPTLERPFDRPDLRRFGSPKPGVMAIADVVKAKAAKAINLIISFLSWNVTAVTLGMTAI
jgi:hypothetical protein